MNAATSDSRRLPKLKHEGEADMRISCAECGKPMYDTRADGQFHVKEQDALDCFKAVQSRAAEKEKAA